MAHRLPTLLPFGFAVNQAPTFFQARLFSCPDGRIGANNPFTKLNATRETPACEAMARGVVASAGMGGREVLRAEPRGSGGTAGLYRAASANGSGSVDPMPGYPYGWVPGPGPGRSSPGLSGIADLGGPRLEGLRPDGEPQVSGESPLAVTCVPPLPCPVACPSGPGCVHRRLLSIQYTTGWRVCYARPGISRLFSPGSPRQSGSGLVRPAPLRPAPPGRQGHCSTGYIALSR